MKLIALVSSYREGRLIRECVRSGLSGCDMVIVYDGPAGDGQVEGLETDLAFFKRDQRVIVKTGEWESDAAKRSDMLAHTRRFPGPVWVLWLDGDEVLIWPEMLRDTVERAQLEPDVFNWRIRLVELDGSTAKCSGKLVRGDLIALYLQSSYQVQLVSGMVMALPNVPEEKPPIQGEPHLLHRSGLRPPQRAEHRLHVPEARWFDTALDAQGLGALKGIR